MTTMFMIVCSFAVIFFAVFLWQSGKPRKPAKLSSDNSTFHEGIRIESALGRRTFAHIERQMAEYLGSRRGGVALVLMGVVLVGTAASVKAQDAYAASASNAVAAEHSDETSSSSLAPMPARHLIHKQMTRLIYTATTPGDHRALAQYFRHEAERKREHEQSFWEVAGTYRLHPPRVDMYRNVSMQAYYQGLAAEARATALADDRLAISQDRLAEKLVASK